MTTLHAAALRNQPGLATAALASCATTGGGAAAALAATLDASPKWPLHELLHSCGLHLTDEKHVCKFYRRLHGATALEVAVTLGHRLPAAELLAAGAAVRPQTWAALAAYCPPAVRDGMAALLAAHEACPASILPHWPVRYRSALHALLLCAHRCQTTFASAAETGRHSSPAPGAAICTADDASRPAEQLHAEQLARLPRDALLRVAVLAAAPLSAW
ncbi:hypothetical protein ABPG75_003355 [Micractinium tetrahymenae]